MNAGISPEQRAALKEVATVLDSDVYLAGGVAVALTIGHRTSRDLGLFVPRDFDPERLAERTASQVPDAQITATAPGTLYLEVRGVPMSILAYRYPLLTAPELSSDLGVRVASADDLVCMKLSAIASRGAARDFWDLHALLEHGAAGGSLAGALELYRRKFVAHDVGHVIRSLVYFGDAEAQPYPQGLDAGKWNAIKADFERWVTQLE